MRQELCIGYSHAQLSKQGELLAAKLKLPINNRAKHQLLITPAKLVLKINNFAAIAPDFNIKTLYKKLNAKKKSALVRALKPSCGKFIIDATAGWGKDAAILAGLGAKVVMVEANPIMAALLADALARRDDGSIKALNLSLIYQNSCHYLAALTPDQYPDVIYLDPMHPERRKAALVKKELQVLQQLLGPDPSPLALLLIAKRKAKVIMKWPQKSPPLLATSCQVAGKTVRFDIYMQDFKSCTVS